MLMRAFMATPSREPLSVPFEPAQMSVPDTVQPSAATVSAPPHDEETAPASDPGVTVKVSSGIGPHWLVVSVKWSTYRPDRGHAAGAASRGVAASSGPLSRAAPSPWASCASRLPAST
jgi:hypothetical protein